MADPTAREWIVGLRGGEEPTMCDFCLEERPSDQLEPEEAGDWVCHACLDRWEREDRDK